MAGLFDHFEPDRYPESPGHRGVDTSVQAAEELKPKAELYRERVFECVRGAGDHGATTEEISRLTGIQYSTAQPRTSELSIAGRIWDSGKRRKNTSGKNAIVWTCVKPAQT